MPFDPEAYPAEELAAQQAAVNVPTLAAQQQARIDAAYNQVAQHAEEAKKELDLLTQARVRFAKAQLYEQIIEGQIFEGDDALTLEVEAEFKDFAERQLMVLLGIEQEGAPNAARLDEDEVNVLKLFAAKLLGKTASIPRPEPVVARQVAPKPVPAPAPAAGQLAAPKRGRGRPPGTGKHQRAAAALAAQNQRPAVPAMLSGQPAQEVKTVQLPNGTIKQVSVQTGQVKPAEGPKPLPMPSPDEMIAQAAAQGDAGLRAIQGAMRKSSELPPVIPINQGY
jgi:hypothetical protein